MRRDIIVIGASAGGVQALKILASRLPFGLEAAIFVVLHIPQSHRSMLPEILNDSGPLPASHPQHHQRIEKGQIYVAPPDHHMLIDPDRVLLWRGPKENNYRPAINPLFRTAAQSHRERVTGVLLTGCMEDGTAGLWSIKHLGGVAIVQDPRQAPFPDMPLSAQRYVQVDHVARLDEIAKLLIELAGENSQARTGTEGHGL